MARLLLACCTLAIGLCLGIAVAVTGVLDVARRGGGSAGDYAVAIGRGLVPAVLLTVLAALLASRALVAVQRLRADDTG